MAAFGGGLWPSFHLPTLEVLPLSHYVNPLIRNPMPRREGLQYVTKLKRGTYSLYLTRVLSHSLISATRWKCTPTP